MTATTPASDVERPLTPRRRERRQAFGDLLAALTRVLDRRVDTFLMRGAFEEMLRRVVPVRSIQLRDANGRWSTRTDAVESIALEVPTADASIQPVLEASFDPACQLSEWDFQMLGQATHIAALVLEIERVHQQLARAGVTSTGRPKRDGAAPLIGSTSAMERLRAIIERVAVTDFTVLLEGPSDPQQKAKDRVFQ